MTTGKNVSTESSHIAQSKAPTVATAENAFKRSQKRLYSDANAFFSFGFPRFNKRKKIIIKYYKISGKIDFISLTIRLGSICSLPFSSLDFAAINLHDSGKNVFYFAFKSIEIRLFSLNNNDI